VQSKLIRSVKIKAARDAALTNLYENEPDVSRLSVKDLVDKFNKNPNKAYTPATTGMIRNFRTELYRKRKQTDPASNPRSNPKDQTKKKRKK
jgi:hypothetical protein